MYSSSEIFYISNVRETMEAKILRKNYLLNVIYKRTGLLCRLILLNSNVSVPVFAVC